MSIRVFTITGGDADQRFGHGTLQNKKTLKILKTFRVFLRTLLVVVSN